MDWVRVTVSGSLAIRSSARSSSLRASDVAFGLRRLRSAYIPGDRIVEAARALEVHSQLTARPSRVGPRDPQQSLGHAQVMVAPPGGAEIGVRDVPDLVVTEIVGVNAAFANDT